MQFINDARCWQIDAVSPPLLLFFGPSDRMPMAVRK